VIDQIEHAPAFFSEEGLEALLQLNHLVLLGRGYDPRAFRGHITVTRRQFFANFREYVKPIRRWYRKHDTENPYKIASQVYVGVLSQPQLYQEGNHRTGSLIASGILLQNGCPPFVLTRQNAVAYFNPSSEIKFRVSSRNSVEHAADGEWGCSIDFGVTRRCQTARQ
jgi:hypothetical protein